MIATLRRWWLGYCTALLRWWLNKRIKWATEDQRSTRPDHPHYDAIQRGAIFAIADWTLQLRRLQK